MGRIRKSYSPAFKAKVGGNKGRGGSSRTGQQVSVHPIQIRRWEKTAIERMRELFTDGKGKQMKEKNLLIGKLTKEIGQLKVELDSS